MKLLQTQDYLLLVDEEAEIKEGDICMHNFGMGYELEILCDKDNLKSNTRFKIIAYYPLTKEAKELELSLLPPFEKEEYIQELAKEEIKFNHRNIKEKHEIGYRIGFEQGYKVAQSKASFTLEDMEKAFEYGKSLEPFDCFGDFIQSLSTQQFPSEFIPELVIISNDEVYFDKQLKTITNSEGKEVLVGTYKY